MIPRARKRVATRRPSKRHIARQASLETDRALPISLSARPLHNMPLQVSSFIGREREITEIRQALSHTRLLTLTGAGGCGKSRLALQVAAGLLDAFTDGVWFVELASLSDSSLVPKVVASAFNIPEHPGVPLSVALRRHLQTKVLLILMDN